jgi:sugar/nucleoside kinase (ribokinase family)
MTRQGILTAGNFLVDYIKLIDDYPAEDMLAIIRSQTRSNGGGPYNMAKNLSLMKAGFPVHAAALLGDDDNGRWILADLEAHGIDTSLVRVTDERGTSFTDVMSNQRNGRRTFFHDPGTNALFDGSQIDFGKTTAKIMHLGLLMILEKMDSFADDGETFAAHFLARASAAGLITSIDLVSTEHPRFRDIALSALRHTDYAIINELEASRILGRVIPSDSVADLQRATGELIALGVRRAAVIHTEHGGFLSTADGQFISRPALKLPTGFIQGANGAGDAFATGFLYGIHEDWALEKSLDLGIGAAAACLSDPTPSNGLLPITKLLDLSDKYEFEQA